jgi:UPF0755 protein
MEFVRKPWVLAVVLVVGTTLSYVLFFAPPSDFPKGTTITIPKGVALSEVTDELVELRIIDHPTVLKAFWKLTGSGTKVQAGDYLFRSPQNVLTVGIRLATGAYGIPPVKITFPEGTTVMKMSEKVFSAFPSISQEIFVKAAKPYEGYLFPDTYLFSPSSDAESIVRAMRKNFDEKTTSLMEDIQASGHSIADIVTMASLLEKEARTYDVRRMVAGILWDRLALGMPLQADAVFGYIFGRDTYSPSYEDLKVNSPYNTYTHKGLPPGPINNPGLEAIQAAINPIKSPYVYYLVDREGVIHYAKTYTEHLANQNQYLH